MSLHSSNKMVKKHTYEYYKIEDHKIQKQLVDILKKAKPGDRFEFEFPKHDCESPAGFMIDMNNETCGYKTKSRVTGDHWDTEQPPYVFLEYIGKVKQ